jgi:hypothetical protein
MAEGYWVPGIAIPFLYKNLTPGRMELSFETKQHFSFGFYYNHWQNKRWEINIT